MGPATTAEGLVQSLAESFRVVTLGGIAVISHGFERNTHDTDIWLDPHKSPSEWAVAVAPHIFNEKTRAARMGRWDEFSSHELAEVIENDGVFRVLGLNRPLDIFRDPNELEIADFDTIWDRATPLADGSRVPDAIDLLVTKQSTGRDKDLQDINFLEAKAEREYLERLPNASLEMAAGMLERFLTPKVAEAAASHPDERVQALGMRFLRELADDGDPFARDLLEKFR